jgi:hypothetical protein
VIQHPAQHLFVEEAVTVQCQDAETSVTAFANGKAGQFTEPIKPKVRILFAKGGVSPFVFVERVFPIHEPAEAPGGVCASVCAV